MPRHSGLRILTASLVGIAAFALNAAADEPKPTPKAAPAHPAAGAPPGAHPPGAPGAAPPGMRPPAGAPGSVPPGYHPPGTPGARPGVSGPGERGAAFRGGPDGHAIAHHDFRGRDFHHFSIEEQHAWAGGAWHHDWHDGRFGWWWYTDGGWYFYDQPVYPMPVVVSDDYVPDPGAVSDEAPPEDPSYYAQPAAPAPQGVAPPQYWYYCDNPAGYYPYVQSCPTQFRPVPATPQPQQ